MRMFSTKFLQLKSRTQKIMQHDLVGVISRMQVCFGIHKSINVIHHVNRMKDRNYVVTSIDSERHLTELNIPS